MPVLQTLKLGETNNHDCWIIRVFGRYVVVKCLLLLIVLSRRREGIYLWIMKAVVDIDMGDLESD